MSDRKGVRAVWVYSILTWLSFAHRAQSQILRLKVVLVSQRPDGGQRVVAGDQDEGQPGYRRTHLITLVVSKRFEHFPQARVRTGRRYRKCSWPAGQVPTQGASSLAIAPP